MEQPEGKSSIGIEVEEVDMKGAVALAKWWRREFCRIYADLYEHNIKHEAVSLLQTIVDKHGGAATPTEVMNKSRSKFKKVEPIRQAMNELVKMGAGYWKDFPTGGMIATRFVADEEYCKNIDKLPDNE